ncbi:L,D-transpeptidase family protein [Phreatobacter sp. AB_2022a]|uniref:L,D-transpeptidase family protein n=1 Tax=Phreatobacter sp. AB_2022a TaxID=3003134 RepID=UPI0022871683|nr:L,D-transpeptidase family protein [Phreatobacter sp. AB_2022a]MCZ0736970.1 L,D-transpeptidase family protein [Phreatobacter sp. AB_2022a]
MSRKQISSTGSLTLSRRAVLGSVASACALAAGSASALAQGVRGGAATAEWGDSFDAGSRSRATRNTFPVLGPHTVQGLEQAIAQYQNIVAQGGWRPVPSGERLRIGARRPAVVLLRDRLMATGDLDPSAGRSDVFDSYVDTAVKRFQNRHGISPDGQVRDSTFAALNVPAAVRLRQLETNLVRVRAYSGFLGNRYIVLNIPAAQAEAVENGQVVSRHVAVVGKADRQSPVISTRVADINFNPYWTVPASIIRKDLIPKMQAEPDYLTNQRIRIFNSQGQEVPPTSINWNSMDALNYRFRQDPFEGNSMGNVRINIPNQHAVYMHDTPSKGLFGEDQRFHSSGCARIQNVRELIAWILQGTPWTRSEIDRVFRTVDRVDARPVQPVPVYWVYVTAWADPDGMVQFRNDIYARDGAGDQVALGQQAQR